MSTKHRKALGRGFGALLKTVDDLDPSIKTSDIAQLNLDNISFNPKQPRLEIDKAKLEELAQSIRSKGVIHPILVRPKKSKGKNYELVAGERRLRASKLAGYDSIPALIRPIKDQDMLEIALIENIQRENLNAIEEAKVYRSLLEEHGYTQEDLAKRIGKNRSTIANLIRLLQLPDVIQTDLARDKISTGHARTLLAIDNPQAQIDLKNKIIEENISVRETEDLIRTVKKTKKPKSDTNQNPLSSQMTLNQDRLRDHFGTKVSIKQKAEKGKVEFEYYSKEDFNRLYSLLLRL